MPQSMSGQVFSAFNRKIDPARNAVKPDGSPNDPNRVETGPTELAFAEWEIAGLEAPNLQAMREHRLKRIVNSLNLRDYDGVLLFDPLNIRYASDTTNMQIWAMHNPFRACFVGADGYMIVWDYKSTNLLTSFNPLVKETRSGVSMYYFGAGDLAGNTAKNLAGELLDVLKEHGNGGRRLAVDKIMIEGLHALEEAGIEVQNGEEVMEKTRAIKGPEDMKAMRCAIFSCERAMQVMREKVRPGMSEAEIWAVMNFENHIRGGEWIETRILSSGQRTNPWFQECGPRIIQNNEILAFDTDMIGVYGMCADLSRTYFVGDGDPTTEQKRVYREAYTQIQENMALLAPGKSFKEITFKGRPLPDEFKKGRYSCMMHGVGLCDEWPLIRYPEDYKEGAFSGELEPGMTLCVESYCGTEGGEFGVKLEDQVLITETGYENLTVFPFDEKLLG